MQGIPSGRRRPLASLTLDRGGGGGHTAPTQAALLALLLSTAGGGHALGLACRAREAQGSTYRHCIWRRAAASHKAAT